MSTVAAIQLASGPNVSANLAEVEKLLQRAVDEGARLAVLPENFAFMGKAETDKLAIAEQEGDGPVQSFLSEQAAKLGIWIIGGTIPLVASSVSRVRSSCLVYDDAGRQLARYDKIHLFDVSIDNQKEVYCESETVEPGDQVVVVDTPVGRIGLSICYDVRFPELYRKLLDKNAQIFAIPSAFTATTGKAHWEVLLRSRAIENLCYVIAPDQGGYHVNGRATYGDSMIVNPWGQVQNRLSQGPGVVTAAIDLEQQRLTREHFPVLGHRRL